MTIGIKSIPNLLTISRMASIPVFFMLFYSGSLFYKTLAALLFLFASLTDFFDGYLARVLHAQSAFGKLFDPIADKMIVAAASVMLVNSGMLSGVAVVPVIIILCREIFISGFREYLAKSGKQIPVSSIGKIKTASQMSAIFLLLLDINQQVNFVAKFILWISSILSLVSCFDYFVKSKAFE